MFGSMGSLRATIRARVESAVFQVLGPASVEGALQGHSPEARAHWRHLVETNKRARQEAKASAEVS